MSGRAVYGDMVKCIGTCGRTLPYTKEHFNYPLSGHRCRKCLSKYAYQREKARQQARGIGLITCPQCLGRGVIRQNRVSLPMAAEGCPSEGTNTAAAAPRASLGRQDARIMRMARDPNAAPEKLAAFVTEGSPRIRESVAGNSKTPPEALAFLAEDDDYEVRAAAAFNRKTPPSALTLLARDTEAYVRTAAAGNPATPPETLAALAGDEAATARGAAARNPNFPNLPKDEELPDYLQG